MDLCFIIDSSGSIRDNNPPGGPDNWLLQLDFLSRLVDVFTIGPQATKIGAVVFSEQVFLAFTLDTYTDAQSIKDAINGLAYLGQTTNTPEGFRVTREQCFNTANGDRIDVQNLAIFISDGVPHPANRRDPALREAEALKNSGVSVIPIGVTNVIDRDFLRQISSPPQREAENFFVAVDFSALGTIRRAVGEGTCEVVTGIRMRKPFSVALTDVLHIACFTQWTDESHRELHVLHSSLTLHAFTFSVYFVLSSLLLFFTIDLKQVLLNREILRYIDHSFEPAQFAAACGGDGAAHTRRLRLTLHASWVLFTCLK